MFDKLSIRNSLFMLGGLTLLFFVVLAGMSLYGQQRATKALTEVRSEGVVPLLAVQQIDGGLDGVRSRMSGYALDVVSNNGARSHLKETREKLPGL